MSVRQCLWILYPVDVEKYLEVLRNEYGAREHPAEPEAFIIGDPGLPFHRPRLIGEELAISGFNRVPLPFEVLEALLDHPELVPGTAKLRWSEEQELILLATLEGVWQEFRGARTKERR